MKKWLLALGAATVIVILTTSLPTPSRAGDAVNEYPPHPLATCDFWWGFQWLNYCVFEYYRLHPTERPQNRPVVRARG